MEHFWKSLVHDGDTISVHRPGFYAKRFQAFCFDKVFKKAEPPMPNSTETRKGTSFRRGNLRRTLSKDQETEVAQPPQGEPLRKVCKKYSNVVFSKNSSNHIFAEQPIGILQHKKVRQKR